MQISQANNDMSFRGEVSVLKWMKKGKTMSLAYSISAYNRKRKWKLFLQTFPPKKHQTVLDVGYSDVEHSETENYIEKHYPFQKNITALGIDAPDSFQNKYPKVRVVQYDGTRFPFQDGEFDVCWSNAVLEHVGNEDDQILFLQEIARTSKSAFITTPNRYFPIETHTRLPFVHFFPKKICDFFFIMMGKGWATGGYMTLLSKRDVKRLLSRAGIENYRILSNRLLFPLDFVIVIDK